MMNSNEPKMSATKASSETTSSPTLAPEASDLNLSGALARLRGDRELLRALIDIFLEDAQPLLDRVKSAYHASDAAALHYAAHSLRGLAANFDAREVIEPALRLEKQASAGDAFDASADVALAQLERATAELVERLRDYRG